MLGMWLFATVALIVAAGAAFWAGRMLQQRRSADALRAALQDAQLANLLRNGWAWHTDAAHAVLRLQAPAGDDRLRPQAEAGAALREALAADALRDRLDAQLPFSGLRLPGGWRLRGAPRIDDAGHFAGYSGVAEATADDDAQRQDQCALHALLTALNDAQVPVLLAHQQHGEGGDWQQRHANAAARRALDEGGIATIAADWQRRLPVALRDAVQSGAGAADVDGWLLRRHVCADASEQLLLLQPPRGGGDDGSDGADAASFSFTVSHDLRAPIRVVEGFTRIVKEDYGARLDRVGNDHLDRVLGAAARMNQMIDAVLTLARLSQQPLARQPVNLSQLAGYVMDELRRGAPERVAEVRIEAGLQTHGDPTLLRLVLENLLGNAWKYSARVARAQIVFGSEEVEGRRAYVVRDNGAGFDMRSADRLFGLFQRLHSAGEFAGTGVGLASVKRIVRRHGGEIWADSEPGRGAAFHFTLRE